VGRGLRAAIVGHAAMKQQPSPRKRGR